MLTIPQFPVSNFLANSLAVVGIGIAMLVLPMLFREVGTRWVAMTVVYLILVHGIAVLLHLFGMLPFPGTYLDQFVVGFFNEPSFLVIWMILAFMVVAQFEDNKRRFLIPAWGLFAVLTIGLITRSANFEGIPRVSITAVVLTVYGTIIFAANRVIFTRKIARKEFSRSLIAGGTLISLLVVLTITSFFPSARAIRYVGTIPENIWMFEQRTAKFIDPNQAIDNSSEARILGSWRLAFKSTADSPVFGTGLGGDAEKLIIQKDTTDSAEATNEPGGAAEETVAQIDRPVSGGVWQVPAAMLRAGGIPSLLALLGIYAILIIDKRTRIFGITFVLVSLTFGSGFSGMLWTFVIASIAYLPAKSFAITLRGFKRQTTMYAESET